MLHSKILAAIAVICVAAVSAQDEEEDLFGDLHFSMDEPTGMGAQLKTNINVFADIVIQQLHKFGALTSTAILLLACIVSGLISGTLIGTIGFGAVQIFKIVSPPFLPILEQVIGGIAQTGMGQWVGEKIAKVIDLSINVVVNYISESVKSFV